MKILFLFVATAIAGFGQIGRATLSGTVTDPQGSAILGAAVTVTHIETNQRFATTTTEAGFYTVPGVPVGAYQVNVEMAGFKKSLRKGIVLQVGDQAQVDVRLELGTVAESVEVTGAAPLVNTSDATLGKVI